MLGACSKFLGDIPICDNVTIVANSVVLPFFLLLV